MKRLNFTDFKGPIVAKAKRLGVKLSNKNMSRIHGLYLDEYLRRYGASITNLFRGTYEEAVAAQFDSPGPSLFSRLAK